MDRPPEILLAEDDDEDAELAFAALEQVGMGGKALRARDGAQVLDLLGSMQPPPCVILLDLKMPRLSGFDVLEAVKREPRLSLIPVVVLTSSRNDQDVRRCYALGANSYVVKPVNFDEFSEMLDSVARYWIAFNVRPQCRPG